MRQTGPAQHLLARTLGPVLLALLAAGCSSVRPPDPAPPYENLLMVVADYRRHADLDLYRHPIPTDLSGQNILRATLERLQFHEAKFPGENPDIVAYTRAACYLRLGEFDRAAGAFASLSEENASPLLRAKALESAEKARILASAARSAADTPTLRDYLDDLEARREKLARAEAQLEGHYEECLARRERERIEMEKALALFRNRYVIPDGSGQALKLMQSIVEYHAQSRLRFAHRLALGHFYFELARDMTKLTPPDRATFDVKLFEELTQAALKEFAATARADGYEEKIEAEAMFDAVEGFLRRIDRMLE